jgi:predicted nucleic acid-binding protein
MRSPEKLKADGKLALDTNAVIACREGISDVCSKVDKADVIILPVIVVGELLSGALNSTKIKNNEKFVHKIPGFFCGKFNDVSCCSL